MPQTQHEKTGKHQQARNKKKPSYYRTVDVGEDVVLETKLANDGTLIVRLSMVEHHIEKVQVGGKPAQQGRTKPRPGKWIRMNNIRVEKLAEMLGDLEEQARQTQLYREADSLPLRHRPFAGLNLGAILIEGVEDAYNPPKPQKQKPQPKRQRQKPSRAEAKPRRKQRCQPGALLHQMDRIVAKLRAAREAFQE